MMEKIELCIENETRRLAEIEMSLEHTRVEFDNYKKTVNRKIDNYNKKIEALMAARDSALKFLESCKNNINA